MLSNFKHFLIIFYKQNTTFLINFFINIILFSLQKECIHYINYIFTYYNTSINLFIQGEGAVKCDSTSTYSVTFSYPCLYIYPCSAHFLLASPKGGSILFYKISRFII